MKREVFLSPRARRQLRAAVRWWRENRDKNPYAFDDDMAEGEQLLEENAAVGKVVKTRGMIRRILLQRVHYYLYYRVTPEERVEVISIWHASRRPPRL